MGRLRFAFTVRRFPNDRGASLECMRREMSDLSLSCGIVLPEPSKGDRATQVGSSHHFTGGIVVGDGVGVRVGLESNTEKKFALPLAYRGTTVQLREQVRFEWRDEHGELHNHFIDFVTYRTDGKVFGHAVRPKDRVSSRYLLELARIKEQAVEQGFLDNLFLLTEDDICPVELFNATLFHSVRRPDCFADKAAIEVIRNVQGVVSIESLVSEIGMDGMGFRAVVRLIRNGFLEMVSYECISHGSQVFKVKEA